MKKIVAKDLKVKYKNKKEEIVAINGISFDINEGELVVILGPSGCGKTTLLKVISGVLDYDEGEMLFGGIDSRLLSVSDRNLSLVSQSFSVYSFMPVFNNIAMPLKNQKVPLDEIERRVHEIAKILDIEHLLSRKPSCLSVGQQQRVSIARALIKKPDIYLFDEPFSNLDPQLKIEMIKLVKSIKERYYGTMFFVTHDINEAIILADRIIVMNKGEIEQMGTPKELLANPTSEFLIEVIKDRNKANEATL